MQTEKKNIDASETRQMIIKIALIVIITIVPLGTIIYLLIKLYNHVRIRDNKKTLKLESESEQTSTQARSEEEEGSKETGQGESEETRAGAS